MWIELEGPPSKWVAKHGKPAEVCGPRGMPSYEPEDGDGLFVYDCMIVHHDSVGQVRMLPRSYGTWSVVAPDGPVPLHHDPSALWIYRPLLYRLHAFYGIVGYGSQQELEWRRKLNITMHMTHGSHDEALAEWSEMLLAEGLAHAILLEHLTPFQRIEFLATGDFRVRGGMTKNVYRIKPGDGFELVSPADEVIATYCLHPEEHIPFDDVALAIKLWLEDPDSEEEALEGARTTVRGLGGKSLPMHRFAERLERDLIA